ncbi:MAG TPA: hypothetical protein VG650_17610 [Mycobacteriales bacterium]|nr:hypothetical protein [Mycobacteriales bacterium]
MTNRLERLMPLTGVVFLLLMVAVMTGPSTPDVNASATKIIDFYSKHRGYLQAQAFLMAYAGAVLVWFTTVLCAYLRRAGARASATASLCGSVVVATAFGVAAGCNLLLTHKSVSLAPASAQTLNLVNNDLPFVALFAGVLLTMVSLGAAVLTTRAFPAWLGWAAVVCGIAAGVGSFVSWFAFMATSVWVLVASVMLYQRQERPSSITLPDSGSGRVGESARHEATTR